MRLAILPALLLIALGDSAGAAQARAQVAHKQEDISPRVAELRRKIEEAGRLMRTLMVAADYSGEFKDYVDLCQNKILELGSSKYEQGGTKPEGELTAIITILRNGKVHGIRIHRTSGHAELDALLADTVREAAPFPPFPANLATHYDRLALTLKFRYSRDD